MDDKSRPLQAAADGEETRRHHRSAVFFKGLWPDDDVGDVGLVLDRHEDNAFCRSRPLPDQHEAGDGDHRVLADLIAAKLGIALGAERGEAFAEKTHRMLFQRQPGRHVIFHDVLAERHCRKRDRGFGKQFVAQMRRQERQCVLGRGGIRPARRTGANRVEPARCP